MIIALHGFLGQPSDWKWFDGVFQDRDGRPLDIKNINLYEDLRRATPVTSNTNTNSNVSPQARWAREFCRRTRSEHRDRGGDHSGDHRSILMGYSMGGRLALHALLEDPELWSGAVIVAAHPGLTSADLRLQRRRSDAQWAERFLHEDWAPLVRAWGDQDVFRNPEPAGDAIELRREETDFERELLARAMLRWSLAEQEDLRSRLAQLRVPLLWVTGQEDRRYEALIGEWMESFTPIHRWVRIAKAGHRVPWDHPSAFIRSVQEFLSGMG